MEGKSYGWTDNISEAAQNRLSDHNTMTRIQTELVPGWSKYSRRGFTYEFPPDHFLGFTLRSATDDDSIWMEYNYHEDVPPDVVALYTQMSKSVAWHQVRQGTVPIHFPFRATYGNNSVDFGSWFNRDSNMTSDKRDYLNKYIPYLHFEANGTMTHAREQ